MSPHKIGRPKAENPLCIDVKVRIDTKTNNKLMEYCQENGITRATAIRKAVKMLIGDK